MSFLSQLAKFWLFVLFAVVFGYFAIYNRESVSISLPPWIEHISVQGYIAYMAFFVLGASVTSLYFGIEHFKKSFQVRKLKRELSQGSGPISSRNQTSSQDGRTEPSIGARL